MATVKVKYIGPKHGKQDLTAGTGLVWNPGQVHDVEAEAAAKLLRYPDAWVAVGEAPAPKLERFEPPRETEIHPTPLPRIERLSKPNLMRLAHTRFGESLDEAMEPAAMRDRIIALENAGRARGV